MLSGEVVSEPNLSLIKYFKIEGFLLSLFLEIRWLPILVRVSVLIPLDEYTPEAASRGVLYLFLFIYLFALYL